MTHRLAVLFCALLALSAVAGDAVAQGSDYQRCVEVARKDPAAGREAAAKWEAIGGGAEARHCAAVSLVGLGAEKEAAKLLTEIGVEGESLPPDDRAASLNLAGELWLRNNQPQLAREAFFRAVQLAPEQREPLIGSARAAAALEDWNAARDSLNRALELNPGDAEALTLRAAVNRQTGEVSMALDDAVKATRLAPDAAIAWFERGAAERALGSKAAAREAWLRAAVLDPEGPAGEMARTNLQLLTTEE